MERDCDYFFLSDTATAIWKNKDAAGQQRMFECLNAIQKSKFFKTVVFKNGKIHEERLMNIAEDVFLITWENFNEKGLGEGYTFGKREYTNLLYIIFKRSYIKRLKAEMIRAKAEQVFYKNQAEESTRQIEFDESFSLSTQKILNEITPNCKELLMSVYIDELSYDEIAKKKNIARENCTKMVWACKQRFLKEWSKIFN